MSVTVFVINIHMLPGVPEKPTQSFAHNKF